MLIFKFKLLPVMIYLHSYNSLLSCAEIFPNTYFALSFMKIKSKSNIVCLLIYLMFCYYFRMSLFLIHPKKSWSIIIVALKNIKNILKYKCQCLSMDVLFLSFILHKLVDIYLELGFLCAISFTQHRIIDSSNKHLYPF